VEKVTKHVVILGEGVGGVPAAYEMKAAFFWGGWKSDDN